MGDVNFQGSRHDFKSWLSTRRVGDIFTGGGLIRL